MIFFIRDNPLKAKMVEAILVGMYYVAISYVSYRTGVAVAPYVWKPIINLLCLVYGKKSS